MNKISYIYILIDPFTNLVRYVGQTQNPNKRLYGHVGDSKRNKYKSSTWVNSIVKKGSKPILEVIDSSSLEDIDFWEKHYISLYKSWGFNLTNEELGGSNTKTRSLEQINRTRNSFIKGNYKGIRSQKSTPLLQIEEGVIVGAFESITQACELIGIERGSIAYALANKVPRCGYEWKRVSKEEFIDLNFKNDIIYKKRRSNSKIKRVNIKLTEKHKSQISLSGRGVRIKPFCVVDNLGIFVGQWDNPAKCCEELGLSSSGISNALSGRYKTHKGYTFKYL